MASTAGFTGGRAGGLAPAKDESLPPEGALGSALVIRGDLLTQLFRVYEHRGRDFKISQRTLDAFTSGGGLNGLGGMNPEERFKAILYEFGYDDRQIVLLREGANPALLGPPPELGTVQAKILRLQRSQSRVTRLKCL